MIADGKLLEDQFEYYLESRKYSELSDNLQDFIKHLFPFLDRNLDIHCNKTDQLIKPDICIWQKDERRFVSLKSGAVETIHCENLISFVEFLRANNIDEYTIQTYLLYHYGDGTINGTGKRRLNSVEVRTKLAKRIELMNKVLNSSKDFIKKFADRVLFQGCNDDVYPAGFIYHGDIDYGKYISRNQLMKHIDNKSWDYMVSCVHIGPFTIRPKARYSGKEIKSDDNRRLITVNYPRFYDDIIIMSKKYLF